MADREYEPIIRERIRNISRGDAPSSSNSAKLKIAEDKKERESVVLWKKPIQTLYNAVREIISLLIGLVKKLQERYIAVLSSGLFVLAIYYLYITDGPHSAFIRDSEDKILWGLWWIWLGVLSSVGLGTGLHTFLLFLGPHIAKVTMAAYECGSTDFVGYPDEFNCPEDASSEMISLWTIMAKVRFPAMCWGAGTALGELPPYFMARAARLSGVQDEDDEDLKEFQELLKTHQSGGSSQNLDFMTRGKLFMHDLVQRVGFFGILAAASIPNPLFDLAGITCGHFLVPFWTFFGATLIGKAVVKMHIQKIFIIFLFSKHHVDNLLSIIKNIPMIGEQITTPIEAAFEKHRAKLTEASSSDDEGNIIGWIFEKFVLVMVTYFVVTIINSLAQARVGRLQKEAREKKS